MWINVQVFVLDRAWYLSVEQNKLRHFKINMIFQSTRQCRLKQQYTWAAKAPPSTASDSESELSIRGLWETFDNRE